MSFGRAILLGLAVFACGCGYHLAAADLRDLGAVAIVTPRNEAGEPGVDRIVADALRRELLRRSGARIAEDPATADVVVSGRVVELATAARSLSSVVLVIEYETSMVLELGAARGKETVVAATRLQETERHLASADVEAQRKNRDEAVRRIASVLAARFMDLLGDEVPPPPAVEQVPTPEESTFTPPAPEAPQHESPPPAPTTEAPAPAPEAPATEVTP